MYCRLQGSRCMRDHDAEAALGGRSQVGLKWTRAVGRGVCRKMEVGASNVQAQATMRAQFDRVLRALALWRNNNAEHSQRRGDQHYGHESGGSGQEEKQVVEQQGSVRTHTHTRTHTRTRPERCQTQNEGRMGGGRRFKWPTGAASRPGSAVPANSRLLAAWGVRRERICCPLLAASPSPLIHPTARGARRPCRARSFGHMLPLVECSKLEFPTLEFQQLKPPWAPWRPWPCFDLARRCFVCCRRRMRSPIQCG